MPASILVTYATRCGSTQEVAEAGLVVNLQPVRKVQSLEGYGLVVLPQAGAPFPGAAAFFTALMLNKNSSSLPRGWMR